MVKFRTIAATSRNVFTIKVQSPFLQKSSVFVANSAVKIRILPYVKFSDLISSMQS